MEKQEYMVKIITPTIMGGANGKLDSNFIRTTEIKSAMRQAFRLVAGKYIDHNQKEHNREEGIKLLYDLESEVFGNTEGKGKFRLIVDPNDIKKDDIKEVKLLPHRENSPKKQAIMPGSKFKLEIISYKYPIEFYKALLDIAFLLGVGFKRNRLFGNMKIEQSESFHFGKSVEKIENFLIENFLKEKGLKERFTENPLFACLSKRPNGDKNYLIKSVDLKDEYLPVDEKFEILRVLYKEIIQEIEKEGSNFILGNANPRQSSYVNFSILEGRSGYMFCILSFYYKNKDFDYNKWREATEKVEKLVKETFEKTK